MMAIDEFWLHEVESSYRVHIINDLKNLVLFLNLNARWIHILLREELGYHDSKSSVLMWATFCSLNVLTCNEDWMQIESENGGVSHFFYFKCPGKGFISGSRECILR